MIDLNKIAIIAGEHNVTYSELLQRVAQFARKTPKGKLTKTVIFSENREGWAYAFFAIWMNEGIVVPVDASSTVRGCPQGGHCRGKCRDKGLCH